MRERHFPRACRSCRAPMARQEDTCWRCGAPWASAAAPRTTLHIIAGGAPEHVAGPPEIVVADSAPAATDARLTPTAGSTTAAALPPRRPSRSMPAPGGDEECRRRLIARPRPRAPEAERQLVASAERHREVVASMQELGRPEAGQHVSVKSVARAVHLVSFALRRAAEAGVPFERLVELAGGGAEMGREGVQGGATHPAVPRRFGAARDRAPQMPPAPGRVQGANR